MNRPFKGAFSPLGQYNEIESCVGFHVRLLFHDLRSRRKQATYELPTHFILFPWGVRRRMLYVDIASRVR
jgi:hypothetical protein